MVTKEELALVDRHLAAENEHRMEDTLATLHPDCVFEDMAMAKVYRGRVGAREYYTTWWTAFDLTVRGRKRHLTTEGIMVAETSYVGAHVGAFCGVPASGRPIELRLAVVIGFRDGLMDGERFYYDLATLLRQIGVTSVDAVGG
jgi:steroid delta-isomerase-like uncharacterized protein